VRASIAQQNLAFFALAPERINLQNLIDFFDPAACQRGVFTKLEYLLLNHKRPRGTPVRTQIKASR
jgi:hypothetical protein